MNDFYCPRTLSSFPLNYGYRHTSAESEDPFGVDVLMTNATAYLPIPKGKMCPVVKPKDDTC